MSLLYFLPSTQLVLSVRLQVHVQSQSQSQSQSQFIIIIFVIVVLRLKIIWGVRQDAVEPKGVPRELPSNEEERDDEHCTESKHGHETSAWFLAVEERNARFWLRHEVATIGNVFSGTSTRLTLVFMICKVTQEMAGN